jgi:hypothetical protein
MTIYLLARILHIGGALAMFAALGVDLAGVAALGRARRADHVRLALEGYRVNAVLGPLSLLLLLVPGMYMATTAWGGQPWLRVSLGALIVIAVLGATVTRRRLGAIAAALRDGEERLSTDAEQLLRDPILRTSFVVRVLLSVGIVVLMSTKPQLEVSLFVLAAALAVAAALSTPFWIQTRGVTRRV